MAIEFKLEKYNDKYDVKTCVFDKKKWFSLIDILRAEDMDNVSMDDIIDIPKEYLIHVPIIEDNRLYHMRFIDKSGINLLKKKIK